MIRRPSIARSYSGSRSWLHPDYLQNGHGKLIAAPFSVRPKPGAPVSMPLASDEVKDGLEILDFTLANAVERMHHDDPLLPLLEVKPDLLGALEKQQRRTTEYTDHTDS